MRRILFAAAVLAVAFAAPASAGYWADFEAAIDAYASGAHDAARQGFTPLAEAGDDRAQYWLGMMYYEGKGVPQDDVRAYMWLGLAAEQGNRGARLSRDSVIRRMTPDQIAVAEDLIAERRQ